VIHDSLGLLAIKSPDGNYSIYSADGTFRVSIDDYSTPDPSADWRNYLLMDIQDSGLLLQILTNSEVDMYALSSGAEVIAYTNFENELFIANTREETCSKIIPGRTITNLAISDRGDIIALTYDDMSIDVFNNCGKLTGTYYGLNFTPQKARFTEGDISLILTGASSYAIIEPEQDTLVRCVNLNCALLDINEPAEKMIILNDYGDNAILTELSSISNCGYIDYESADYSDDSLLYAIGDEDTYQNADGSIIVSGLLSNTGEYFAFMDANGYLYLNDSGGNRLQAVSSGNYYPEYSFSNDDRFFYLLTYELYNEGEYIDKNLIKVFDLHRRKWIAELEGTNFEPLPNSAFVAISGDYTIGIYAMNAYTESPEIIDISNYALTIDTLTTTGPVIQFDNYIYDVGISGTDIWIVQMYSDAKTYCLNSKTLICSDTLDVNMTYTVDGAGENRQYFYSSDSLKEYHSLTGGLLPFFVPENEYLIADVKYISNRKQLLILIESTKSEEAKLLLLDAETGKLVDSRMVVSQQYNAQMRLSPDGTLIALLAASGSISIYRTDDLTEITNLAISPYSSDFVFSSNGEEILVACDESDLYSGTIEIYRVQDGELIASQKVCENGIIRIEPIEQENKYLLVSGNCILLYDTGTNRILRSYSQGEDTISGLRFIPDNNFCFWSGYSLYMADY
jgi:WD40 repeat protein